MMMKMTNIDTEKIKFGEDARLIVGSLDYLQLKVCFLDILIYFMFTLIAKLRIFFKKFQLQFKNFDFTLEKKKNPSQYSSIPLTEEYFWI